MGVFDDFLGEDAPEHAVAAEQQEAAVFCGDFHAAFALQRFAVAARIVTRSIAARAGEPRHSTATIAAVGGISAGVVASSSSPL